MSILDYLIGIIISPAIAPIEDSVDEMENHIREDSMKGEETLEANNPTHGKECEKPESRDYLSSNGYNEVNKDYKERS